MIVGIFAKGFNHFISDYQFLLVYVRTKGTGQNVLNRTFLTLIWDESPDGGLVLMSLPTGATVVGIKCSDGAVVATDSLVSWGTFILTDKGVKAFKLTDSIVLASAGLTSDYQMLVNRLRAYIKLYELNQKKSISVRALSKMLSNTLYQQKMAPLYVQTVIVGVDESGPALYSLDMGGSLIPDEFTATGSGTQTAYGVLEKDYKEGLTVKEAEKIAVAAVKAGIARDAQSGGSIHVMTVTKDGVTEQVFDN